MPKANHGGSMTNREKRQDVAASRRLARVTWRTSLAIGAAMAIAGCTSTGARQETDSTATGAGVADDRSPQALADGQRTFRFETFGDEQFWTDTARMHEVVQRSVSPATALKVGLKVDADAIPAVVARTAGLTPTST